MHPVVTVLLGDPRLPDRSKPGGRFTADDFDQVVRLKAALGELGSYRFDYLDDHRRLLQELQANPPDFVLNFCDTGYRNQAALEQHIPAYLEMLGIPYSGCPPVPLGLCYDKGLVRAAAQSIGVPVPWETLLLAGQSLPEIGYPAFIKPNRGDGSVGISVRSLVRSPAEAESCIHELNQLLPGEALIVQEFLDGDEYGVGIIGNPEDRFQILPVLEVDYSALDPSLPRLLDYGSKTDPESPYWTDIRFRQARLGEAAQQQLYDWCRSLFARLGLRDYARFDFRTAADGGIRLMEINPNPAWCWDGKLAHMAELKGLRHSDLLAMIIEASLRRFFPAG